MSRTTLKNIARLIADTNIPVEKAFLADLERSIELTDKSQRRAPSKTYKPSSMQCIRNMYYQVIGEPQNDEPAGYSLIGICNSGSDIHVRIQTAVSEMKQNGIDCEYVDVASYVTSRGLEDIQIVSKQGMETKLYHKKYNMSFLCDGIIRYKGKYYILEIKTENSYKWQSRSEVDSKHYDQATAYSIAFGIDDVLFVYINRDVLTMKTFMFKVTDEMKYVLVDKIGICEGYVAAQKVPPVPADIDKRVCAYCGYRQTCGR